MKFIQFGMRNEVLLLCYIYIGFCLQVVNVSNTMKIAVDFLSPFNALEFQKNIERIRKEREREDYMGIWRTMHTALTRALNILHGAEEIELDRKNLKEELERVCYHGSLFY